VDTHLYRVLALLLGADRPAAVKGKALSLGTTLDGVDSPSGISPSERRPSTDRGDFHQCPISNVHNARLLRSPHIGRNRFIIGQACAVKFVIREDGREQYGSYIPLVLCLFIFSNYFKRTSSKTMAILQ